jgi:phasin family protein
MSHVAFRIPGFDYTSVIEIQRKNLEALTRANQLAVEGLQAVLRRQIEFAQQSAEHFALIFGDLMQPNGSPVARLAKQAEHSKQAVEHGLANARELSALATKAGTEAFEIVAKRVTESLDEVREYASKQSHGR